MGGKRPAREAPRFPPEARRPVAGWCLYDWANSAFPTVIETFVFAAFFTQAVAADPERGTELWGYAQSAAALAIALLSPVLGAIADQSGRRKPWLAAFTVLCILSSAALWFTLPEPSSVTWALTFVALGTIGFECAFVFYNAMLPEVAPRGYLGRVSGWGWALGYSGGLCCLLVALFGLVQVETPPFGLEKDAAEHVRATTLLVAVWMVLFAWPILALTPDRPSTGVPLARAVRQGLATLWRTIRGVRSYANTARYLLARMIYTDGINTLFAFGGIYAAGTFGLDFGQVIMFGIGINVTAGLGALAFSWIDDWIGPKRTIQISLCAITIIGTALLMIESVTTFWVLGLALGIFFGPVQAASRSMMGRLAPEAMRAELFGLYALSGKATAFVGPALLGWVTAELQSQRAGMATVLIFLVAGFLLLLPVREPPQ